MAISTTEDSDEGGFEHDPFQNVDYSTAMALLDSTLHQRLGEVAAKEQGGIIGAVRMQLQRLWPQKFGAEITPQRIGRLFRFIQDTVATVASEKFPHSWEQPDRDRHVRDEVASTVQKWKPRDLRGYLSEVDTHVREQGSFAYVLAEKRAESQRAAQSAFAGGTEEDEGVL
jgi:hypothetical protein